MLRQIVRRAVKGTMSALGGWPALLSLLVLPALGATLHVRLDGPKAMSAEAYIWALYVLAPLGVAFLVIFGVNVLAAPFYIERERRHALEGQLVALQARLEGPPSVPPILRKEHSEQVTNVAEGFDPEGLYVGFMRANTRRVRETQHLEISVRCFNASGVPIAVQRVNGVISFSEALPEGLTQLAPLRPPRFSKNWPPVQSIDSLKEYRTNPPPTEYIGNLREFKFTIEQYLPPDLAAKLSELDVKQKVYLHLDTLDVIVGPHGAPNLGARLPLWTMMTFPRDAI